MQRDLRLSWYWPAGTSGTRISTRPAKIEKPEASGWSGSRSVLVLSILDRRPTGKSETVFHEIYLADFVGNLGRRFGDIPIESML